MKKKIALLMAAIMSATTFSAVSVTAASSNSLSKYNMAVKQNEILLVDADSRGIDLINTQDGLDSIASAQALELQIRPTSEVRRGESIILTVENGKFDKRLVESDPFIFRTEMTGTTYGEIIEDDRPVNDVLTAYVGNEGSRKLPYGFRYINEEQIEVYLYPISDEKVNQNNSDVTKGKPYYGIKLPVTTEGSKEGSVYLNINSNDSIISNGSYNIAMVSKYAGEIDINVPGSSSNSISINNYKINKDKILITGISDNSLELLDTKEGMDLIKEGSPIALQIIPLKEITPDATLLIDIENGKFDKKLVESDPYIFRTELTGLTYDEIAADNRDNNSVLTTYIGNEGSRRLPYKMQYLSDTQIAVTLYPIGDDKVNQNNFDVTKGVPYYNIALPITTEGSKEGKILINVNNKTAPISPGTYTVAKVCDVTDNIEVSPSGSGSLNSIVYAMNTDKNNIVISDVEDNSLSVLDTKEGIDSLKDGTPVSLNIRPKVEILEGSSIILIAENGKFDERLVNADPYIFRTELSKTTYDMLINDGRSADAVLTNYVGNEDSRKLPYGFRYISPEMIEVYLYPIGDDKVNQNNNDVTKGTPYYSIPLPITTEESSDGYVKVGIYSNNTPISGGSYEAAIIGDGEITENGASTNTLSRTNTAIKKDNILIIGVENKDVSVLDTQKGIESLASGTAVSLRIRPLYEVKKGTTVKLKIENGVFDERLVNADPYIFKTERTRVTYDEIIKDDRDTYTVLKTYIGGEGSRKLPYGMKFINNEEIEVSFYPIGDDKVNRNNNDVTRGTPYYDIALPVVAKDSNEGDIKVTIEPGNTIISGGTYTVAKVMPDEGSATAFVYYADVDITSEDTYIIPDITIKEDYEGTFNGQKIKIVLGGNCKWINEGKITSGINCRSQEVVKNIEMDERTIEFTLAEGAFDNSKKSSIIISGFEVETIKDGDIYVIVSGDAGINSATVKVGTVAKASSTEESTSEATTSDISERTTVNENSTETTTVRSSSGSGGGGGGGSSRKITTTTTTEATTELTTSAVMTETKTEETTETLPEVKVVIGSNDIVVNDKTYTMDAAPYIQSESNSTLVPLRFVAIALSGGDVESADSSDMVLWDANSKKATIVKNNVTIEFIAGSSIVSVNGVERIMDNNVAAEIKDGRMFVPFRFIGETLGSIVDWEADTKTAVYKLK